MFSQYIAESTHSLLMESLFLEGNCHQHLLNNTCHVNNRGPHFPTTTNTTPKILNVILNFQSMGCCSVLKVWKIAAVASCCLKGKYIAGLHTPALMRKCWHGRVSLDKELQTSIIILVQSILLHSGACIYLIGEIINQLNDAMRSEG